MDKYRIEKDCMGEIEVEESRLWGASTERSRRNFKIGIAHEEMPKEVIKAIAIIKAACAIANNKLNKDRMTDEKTDIIVKVAKEIIASNLDEHFPLVVFQTGSGTQTNMNVNEVIANYGNKITGKNLLHPNDDVNMSQSTNDVFPSAMHIAAVSDIEDRLIPAITKLRDSFLMLENKYTDIVKCGRTHLQDATPLTFGQELSGYRATLTKNIEFLEYTLVSLKELAIGGTAVGTGINTPIGFDKLVAQEISNLTGKTYISSNNKFHSLSSKGEIMFAHGALKTLAMDLHKIANDIRLLASGPRCGLGEISIPENEPGSSIMPGKVNPTQCEAMTMVSSLVVGNDATIAFAGANGHLELNVYMPVIINAFLQSTRLLSDAITSFNDNCVVGITPNIKKMQENVNKSLMNVTALSPYIGYEKAAQVAKKAYEDDSTLKEACVALGYLSIDELDKML